MAACAATLAGCASTTPVTGARLEFAREADQICGRLAAAIKPLRGDATRAVKQERLDAAADLTRRVARGAGVYLDQLARLEAPDADRDAVARWLSQLREQQARTLRVADAIAARDPATATRLNEEIAGLQRRTDRFAAEFGMRVCGT